MSDLHYYDCPVCGSLYTDAHNICPDCARRSQASLLRTRAPLRTRYFVPLAVCLIIGTATATSFLVVEHLRVVALLSWGQVVVIEHPRATLVLSGALAVVTVLSFLRRR